MNTIQELSQRHMRNVMDNLETLLGVSHIYLCFVGGFGIGIFCPILVFWEDERLGVFMCQSGETRRVSKRSASCADHI